VAAVSVDLASLAQLEDQDTEAEARLAEQLRPGSEVEVGPLSLRVAEVLGSGSYSIVWRAEVLGRLYHEAEPNGAANGLADGAPEEREVALKDVCCRSSSARRQALLEVEVLLALEQQQLPAGEPWASRLPRVLGHRVDPCEEGWYVRMALTRLPGDQLDKWLRREAAAAEEAVHAAMEPGSTVRVPSWTSHIKRGLAMAESLLLQLGPTLERMAPLAWHRDVNSHNMLVSDAVDGASLALQDPGFRASFWLCDLGLAVDSTSWVSDSEGEGGAWRVTDIGGDCRYWPASSWMVHCYGADYLEGQEDFCRQYQRRLDIHGLAITAVEVACSTAVVARRAGAPAGEDDPSCWAALLDAWKKYRTEVTHWWEAIYSVFSVGGDFRPVHAWLVEECVAEQVVDLTTDIRQALLCCSEVEHSEGAEVRGRVLRVLAELMDETSRLELGEACAHIEEVHASQADLRALRAAVNEGIQVLDSLKAIPTVAEPLSVQAPSGTASPPPPLRIYDVAEVEEVARLREAQAQLRQDLERLRTAKASMQRARRSCRPGPSIFEP